jgi:anti-sigma B factor antagonist
MSLTERQVGDITIVDLTGKLTFTEGAGKLKEKVRSLLLEGRSRIVLNLANAVYIDSTGLGEVAAAHGAAARGGGVLKLASPGRRTRDLLLSTNLLTALDCYDSEAEAIASFGAREP